MQPGNPGQDPYGEQNPQDPTAPPNPYAQPPQSPGQPAYGQPGAGQHPYAQPQQDPWSAQPTSGQPYGAAPGYPPPGYGVPGQPPPNNTLGLLAMIFGIVGIPLGVCCGLFGTPFGIAGVVLGILGLNRANQGQATNRGQALAGLICGAVGIVLAIVAFILGQVIPWEDFMNNA
ncbi:MAG TPA: DUF4190 domain-containing protein [Micromonosporaceae bacterium]